MTKTMRTAIAIAASAALLLPAAAQAHVTVQPGEVPAGGFTRLDVRVPNEQDDAATTKVEVQMPDGFIFASYEAVPGWTTEVKSEKLDEPIEAEGGSYDTQVSSITWTADGDSQGIQPGQFRDFGLSVGIPEQYEAGETLTFPAIQTYDNGDVVRWIGDDPEGDDPASTVTLTEASEDHHAAAAPGDEEEAEPVDSVAEVDEEDGDDGAPTWLAILGVVLGALGLAAGGAALAKRR